MCPNCGQNAPLVYRGVSAFCSACGTPRVPFTANAVNLKGKPAKIGGTVASVAGWVILAATLAAALIIGAILQAVVPPAGWIVGFVIAAIGIAAALALVLGGRALKRSGTHAAESARMDAVGTLAAHQKGNVTAQQASEALGCSYEEADAFLTALAKRPDAGVSLEIDEEGKIFYRFARYAPAQAWPGEAKVRVGTAIAPAAGPGGAAQPAGANVPLAYQPTQAPADIPIPAAGQPAQAPPANAAAKAGTTPPPAAPQPGAPAAPPRVATIPMGEVPAHVRVQTGPGGTKVVPAHPAAPPPREAEVVAADEGAEEARRRAR